MSAGQGIGGGPDGLTEEDRARADVYSLLGALLAKSPDREMLGLLRGIEVPSGVPGMPEAWRDLKLVAKEADADATVDEYFALFIGLGRGEIVPYASSYLTGYLMEKPLADLRSELNRLGFERHETVKEPEDHAAILCQFMGMIIAENRLSLSDQRGVFERFVKPWMQDFFEDLEQAESATFYRAVGRLGKVFIGIEKHFFSLPT